MAVVLGSVTVVGSGEVVEATVVEGASVTSSGVTSFDFESMMTRNECINEFI